METSTLSSVVRGLILSEKASGQSNVDKSNKKSTKEKGRSIVLDVRPDATKAQIKNALEKFLGMQIESVRTCSYMGKAKAVAFKKGKTRAFKKAYVELKPGSNVDFIEGL